MDSFINFGIVIIFLVALFKSTQAVYRKIIWHRRKTPEVQLAQYFKENNSPVGELNDEQLDSLFWTLCNESINEISCTLTHSKDNFDPLIYRVFDLNLKRKNWLSSNTDASVSHTLNGFEFFVPGLARHSLGSKNPESVDVVFYGSIAVFVGIEHEYSIFDEKEASTHSATNLTVKQTVIETSYEALADSGEFDIIPGNGGRMIRAIYGDRMAVFRDDAIVTAYSSIIAGAGIFSAIFALLGAVSLLKLPYDSYLLRLEFLNHFFLKLSFLNHFLIFFSLFWGGAVTLFSVREFLKPRKGTVLTCPNHPLW
ncbi:hypothetical protein [Marinobacter sp. NFXS9]|uniref:hypothetical protein n=1 Tax=Marinobacter sp. NFXS9 TaxID=2818433 RepID=UPI0032DFF842